MQQTEYRNGYYYSQDTEHFVSSELMMRSCQRKYADLARFRKFEKRKIC